MQLAEISSHFSWTIIVLYYAKWQQKKTQNCNLCICSSVQFLSANASDFIRPIPDLGPVDEVWEYVHLLYQTLRCLPSGTVIIIITKTMFMVLSSWQSHCESSPGSFDECRMALSGRRPKTKPDDLGCESAYTGCQKLHPPLTHSLLRLTS